MDCIIFQFSLKNILSLEEEELYSIFRSHSLIRSICIPPSTVICVVALDYQYLELTVILVHKKRLDTFPFLGKRMTQACAACCNNVQESESECIDESLSILNRRTLGKFTRIRDPTEDQQNSLIHK
jgi:hypothetical protein